MKPRRLVNRGFKLEDLPLLGVFALDSPTRPNPIGLTLVRLLERNGRFLKVSGLDFFNGTPVLDIKGYRPTYRVDESIVKGEKNGRWSFQSWEPSFLSTPQLRLAACAASNALELCT